MGVLIAPDGSFTLAGLLLVLGVPLLAIGQYKSSSAAANSFVSGKPIQFILGTVFVAFGLAMAVLGNTDKSRDVDSEDLRYEAITAEELLNELKSLGARKAAVQELRSKKVGSSGNIEESERKRVQFSSEKAIKCLNALAMKCGKDQARKKREAAKSEDSRESHKGWPGLFQHRPHVLEILCQEAAYIVLGQHPNDDNAVCSALSLFALVAGDDEVRRRNIKEADQFGLNLPICAMRDALSRAKSKNSPQEEKERVSAELQRKGCLLLGALSNENKCIATKVVDEDGLVAVLDAVEWYRFHEEVANWGLWAVFVLCYDHEGNKGELIKLGGIQKICRAMKDIPKSLEVARHGIGVLFDLMRMMPGNVHDVSQIRMIALNAGMQDVVKRAMEEFPNSKEIMLMGQQMLVATGYQGEIPMTGVPMRI